MAAAATTDIWGELVGQEAAVAVLQRAVAAAQQRLEGGAGIGMTHAWLFTGPPGSGRSNAAIAFAKALQTPPGEPPEAHHPDIAIVRTDRLNIEVEQVHQLVRTSALRPTRGRWQIVIIEDADRLTDKAADALLKSVEEPPERTLWILCAPTPEDVVVTIRSRCRHLLLGTPPVAAITRLLHERDGVEIDLAEAAARASQGHIGRARALASNPQSRQRRERILAIPGTLRDSGAALQAAADLEAAAKENSEHYATELDARELADLRASWGVEERGRRPTGYAGAASALERDQKRRRTRMVRDSIDGALIELMSFYRDVIAAQTAPGVPFVNADVVADIQAIAEHSGAEDTLRRLDAIAKCRERLQLNAAPLLSLEDMMVQLTW